MAILVYDGDCGFCRRCVRWGERRWRDVSPVTSATYQATSSEISADDLASSVWWIDEDVRFHGAAAVARAVAAAPTPWCYLGRAMMLAPVSRVLEPGYRFVVRWRHRLPGSGACRRPR